MKNREGFMTYTVNGITFSKEELVTISLDEIKVNTISRSHLFYLSPGAKNAFLLVRAGDLVEQEFIDKYKAKGLQSVYELHVAELEDIQAYKDLFKSLETSKNEKERQIIAQSIAKKFGQDYWQESEKSILSFTLTCYEHFYKFDPSVIQKLQEKSMTLYSRAILGSAISVMTCFVHRICDPYFIKDLYNSVFVMDYGLLEADEFTYTLAFACETERNNPGQGLNYLIENKRSKEEQELFLNHPIISSNFAAKNLEIFFNPEIVDVIKYHHEKVDGSGFPEGFSYSAMSDFETFLMFSDYIIPFGEHIFQKGDGRFVIKKAFSFLSGGEQMYSIPLKKILSRFESMMDWSINKVELNEQVRGEIAS